MTSQAFVDFYRDNDISPVRQDISDIQRHFERRSALYRALGIAPRYVTNSRVLEFGPGSGHNAVYTASLLPARYTLVDANPRGLKETAELLAQSCKNDWRNYEIVASLAGDFASDEAYDLVLAEGMIPFQHKPAAMLRTIAGFVELGGLLVITCADSVSAIGEVGRRLLAARISPLSDPISRRLEALRPIFAPHLATLAGMSRPVDDWIYDNILHPWTGQVFSLNQAVDTIRDEFDVFGSSPQISVDLRWYKDLHGNARAFNDRFVDAYLTYVANLLDYRVDLPPHSPALGRAILSVGDRLYTSMQAHDRGESGSMQAAIEALQDLIALIAPISQQTASSLKSLVQALNAPTDAIAKTASDYAGHFGRGQQYVSFARVRPR